MKNYEFFKAVKEVMPEEYIDHHEGNIPDTGDLYVKKTTESEKLVKQYDFPASVSTFESQKEPFGVWYEIYVGWCKEYEEQYAKEDLQKLRMENESLKTENECLLDCLHGTITAEGSMDLTYVNEECLDTWKINTSSILTKLIQEAGRWCENYASDLFILWGSIKKQLEEATIEPGEYVFAFRESGVDNNEAYRLYADTENYYRAVWILDVSIHERNIIMKLKKKN